MTLPKKFLSYSALSLWYKDKDLFRRRYYLNEKSPDNVWTLFGRKVHEALESGKYPHIPRFSAPEHKIEVVIEGIPILGYIDSFAPKRRSFLDFKTGMRKEDGSPRWTVLEVQKLDQLPFYSLLLEKKYGYVNPTCKLIWLPVRWKQKKEQVGSMIIEGDSGELELTGEYYLFKRIIEPFERENMIQWIITGSKQISDDYTEFLQRGGRMAEIKK